MNIDAISKDDIIYIVGSAVDLPDTPMGKRIAQMRNVEFITPERARELNLRPAMAPPTTLDYPSPIIFDQPFRPPLTRAQRRQQSRYRLTRLPR